MRPEPTAARQTHSTIGRPAMGRRTLRERRVEPRRAGMTPRMRWELIGKQFSWRGLERGNVVWIPDGFPAMALECWRRWKWGRA